MKQTYKERREAKHIALGLAKRNKSLVACAIHESAHLIASFHFGVPLGKRGIHIRKANDSSEFVGFTDVLLSQVYGDLSELGEERLLEYMSQALIGPITEYRFRNYRTDDLLIYWANDIATALAVPFQFDNQRGVSFCDEIEPCKTLTTYCLTVIDDPDTVLPDVLPDRNHFLGCFGSAAVLAERIRKQYETTILRFANALILAPNTTLSDGEASRWEQEHFVRKAVD